MIVGAFAGNLKGNVWKFDLSSSDAGNWKVGFSGAPLYTTKDSGRRSQPITAAPALVAHPRGGNIVLVGTGKLFEEGDQSTTTRRGIAGRPVGQAVPPCRDCGRLGAGATQGAITSPTSIEPRSMTPATTYGADRET